MQLGPLLEQLMYFRLLKTQTLANSNLLVTRSDFQFLSGHFLYNLTRTSDNPGTFFYFPWRSTSRLLGVDCTCINRRELSILLTISTVFILSVRSSQFYPRHPFKQIDSFLPRLCVQFQNINKVLRLSDWSKKPYGPLYE